MLHEAALETNGMYVSGSEIANILAGEKKFHHQPSDGLNAFSTENRTLEEITRKIVEQALSENDGNQSLTARKLGISRSTLWRMLGNR